MCTIVLATFCAIFGLTNAGLIGSGFASPIGDRSRLIDNGGFGQEWSGAPGLIGTHADVLGARNVGLIGSGFVSPFGVHNGLISNAGLGHRWTGAPGLTGPHTDVLGATNIGSGFASPIGVRSGLIENAGLGLRWAGTSGSIGAHSVSSTVVSGSTGAILDNRNLGLNSGIFGAGLINNGGLGFASDPAVIATHSHGVGAIHTNNGLVYNSGLGLPNSGIWNGAGGIVSRPGLLPNQWW